MITGAASGIGWELAKQLHQKGVKLLLTDIDEMSLKAKVSSLSENPSPPMCRALDVRNRAQIHQVVQEFLDMEDSLDYLYNCAGVATRSNLDEDYSQYVIEVNLLGSIHTAEEVIVGMRQRKKGTIVNIASIAGLIPFPKASAYAASKAGLVGYGRSLQITERRHGIRIVTVCPGFIRTPMIGKVTMQADSSMQVIKRRAISVEDAVSRILKEVRGRKHIVVFPIGMRIIWKMYRLFPRLLRFIMHRIWGSD